MKQCALEQLRYQETNLNMVEQKEALLDRWAQI